MITAYDISMNIIKLLEEENSGEINLFVKRSVS